jgi:hypothetical protein
VQNHVRENQGKNEELAPVECIRAFICRLEHVFKFTSLQSLDYPAPSQIKPSAINARVEAHCMSTYGRCTGALSFHVSRSEDGTQCSCRLEIADAKRGEDSKRMIAGKF